MQTYEDCRNWGYRLCDPFVKHLFEPTQGYMAIYTSKDIEEAVQICQKCPNYEKKSEKP
jgi:hypothetical protein